MPALLSDHDLLRRLVAFDSVSTRSNRPVADFVAEYLDRDGVHVDMLAGPRSTPGVEKVNLVARTGPASDDDAGLILSGHLDVVPADEPEWDGDPFAVREADGNLYGRGTCDMKGFIALALNELADRAGDGLAAPLVVLLTCDEELGSVGAQHLTSSWTGPTLPGRAIIGEPTSLRVVRMHKGHLTIRVTTDGRSAHSGSPHLGHNAIEPAAAIVAALADLRRELERERSDTSEWFTQVPFPVLNVARITGGDALNVVPDRCVVDVGVRLLPGGDAAAMLTRLTAAVTACAGPNEAPPVVTLLNDNPPMLLHDDASIHETLCTRIGQTGSHGVSFASDAGVLQRDLGIECVLYGPGTIEVAHRPNEFVPIDELAEARAVIGDIVSRFCGQPSDSTRGTP